MSGSGSFSEDVKHIEMQLLAGSLHYDSWGGGVPKLGVPLGAPIKRAY